MNLLAIISGALFGAGVCVSGMVRPSKVLGFLDFGGAFDASLLLVMVSGLVVSVITWRVVARLRRDSARRSRRLRRRSSIFALSAVPPSSASAWVSRGTVRAPRSCHSSAVCRRCSCSAPRWARACRVARPLAARRLMLSLLDSSFAGEYWCGCAAVWVRAPRLDQSRETQPRERRR